jgi:hypothetical protein
MYLARFDADPLSWLQALIRVEDMPRSDDPRGRAWKEAFGRLVRAALADPDIAMSLRVVLDGEGLRWTLGFVGVPEREPALRRVVGAFTRLNAIAGDCVTIPDDRSAHDALADDFPALRCRITMPAYRQETAWFACDFAVAPLLDDLLARAQALAHGVGYHVNVQRAPSDRERLRAAAKNVLAVQALPGITPAALDLQRRLAARLNDAGLVHEEILGAADGEAAEWLQRELRGAFIQRYGPLRFEPPDFTFSAEALEASLVATRHAAVFAPPSVDEVCSAAMDDAAAVALLSWTPVAALAGVFAGDRRLSTAEIVGDEGDGDAVEGLTPAGELVPYEGPGDFVFLSYKREDLARIVPIVRPLADAGYRIWYDRGIPGGAEWDALIEEKIERCRLVLLFVSRKSVASRYVRREVKFADALNKPIVSVRLEPVELAHGMKMFLNQYQVIDASATAIAREIERAVKYTRLL